jgi:hypothetical protein
VSKYFVAIFIAADLGLRIKRYTSLKVTLTSFVASGLKRLISSGRRVRCVFGGAIAKVGVAGESDFGL